MRMTPEAQPPARVYLHVVQHERGNITVTVDIAAEVMKDHTLQPTPVADRDAIPPPGTQWLPAVSTSQAALDDRQGWYQRTLATELRMTTPTNVINLAVNNLSPEEREQTSAFTRHTLGSGLNRVRPFSLPADTYTWSGPTWSAMVKHDGRVVTHVGILYRIVQVGALRVAVGGIGGVMTLSDWRGRGYARAAVASATAFVGTQLWAPFALIVCPKEDVGFYLHLGWSVADGAILCEQPGGPVTLPHEVAVVLPCQGDAAWPGGSVDLLGFPW